LVVCLGKSTYARCGIIVNVTPLEPEWEGHVTLEFSNTTPLPARIYANEGIAQMLFFESDEVCETSYRDRGGKYQGQTGVTLAKNLIAEELTAARQRGNRTAELFSYNPLEFLPHPRHSEGEGHAFPFPRRHHRRRLSFRERLRPGHSRPGQALEDEGMEILGVTSYGDLSSFAQQQSRASGFILSVDDDDFSSAEADETIAELRAFVQEIRLPQHRHPDLPLRRDAHQPAHPQRRAAGTARLHPHVRGHAGIRRPPDRARDQGLPGFPAAARSSAR
jgi:hypothetical protein